MSAVGQLDSAVDLAGKKYNGPGRISAYIRLSSLVGRFREMVNLNIAENSLPSSYHLTCLQICCI